MWFDEFFLLPYDTKCCDRLYRSLKGKFYWIPIPIRLAAHTIKKKYRHMHHILLLLLLLYYYPEVILIPTRLSLQPAEKGVPRFLKSLSKQRAELCSHTFSRIYAVPCLKSPLLCFCVSFSLQLSDFVLHRKNDSQNKKKNKKNALLLEIQNT